MRIGDQHDGGFPPGPDRARHPGDRFLEVNAVLGRVGPDPAGA
jgi:hypothetical protein